MYLYVTVRVKSYPITGLDRSLGIQEVESSRISRQSALESVKVVSLFNGRLHPQEITLVLIFV